MARAPRPIPEQSTSNSSGSRLFAKKAVGTKAKLDQPSEPKYRCDIFQNFTQPMADVNEFLSHFAPASTAPPKCPEKKFAAKISTGEGKEGHICKQLVKGLDSLVRKVPEDRRLQFHGLGGTRMRYPFALCDLEHHEIKLDMCATLPGACTSPVARWRNFAVVFDIHSRADDDPMAKSSKSHETSFLHLSWIAYNTMLAQGKLYVFIVGIYGRRARIYRVDRSGGICSPLFNYVSEPHVLHDFLWRFVHPKFDGCVTLGDDPTVKQGTHEDRVKVQELIKQYDTDYTYTAETKKAIRRVTATRRDGTKATYLVYKLLHTEDHLFGRATAVWEAFALNSDGDPTGTRVVIKEAWRHTSMPSEARFYDDLREAAEADESGTITLAGIVKLECCSDLGTRETEMFAVEDPRPGHRTMKCQFGRGEVERSLVRMVFSTVGTPIADFDSTYDMVCALRDAIEGHRQAYLGGFIHRDISIGNVMMEKKADGTVSGFIHDLDYAFSWKCFLLAAGLPVNLGTWEKYVREEHRRTTRQRMGNPDITGFSDSTRSYSESLPSSDETKSYSESLAPSDGTENSKQKSVTTAPSEFHVDSALQKDSKRQTGTLYFMAIDVLCRDEPRDTHEARHDLESFYWLLVFLVLRHRPCTTSGLNPESDYTELFKEGYNSIAAKRRWLFRSRAQITVRGNAPLTKLLEDLRKLCKTNYREDCRKPVEKWMTHEDVLQVFGEALKDREQWPKADCAQIRLGRRVDEPVYHDEVAQPTAVFTKTVRSERPTSTNDEEPPRPGSAAPANVESHRESEHDGRDGDTAPTPAEPEVDAQEDTRPVHAMETRARAAARARAAQAVAVDDAPRGRSGRTRQGRKRGRAQGEDATGEDAPLPSKRPRRMVAPNGRARETRQTRRRTGRL